jgi:nucleotide-binding universal stress UspA family protein
VIDSALTGAVAEARRRDAEAAIKALVAGAQDVPVGVKIVTGNHIDAIQAAAQEESADLVAIGMHHSVTELDLFRGSTGERVLKSGTRPVLMVKQAVKAPYRRVMVATDFSASARDAVAFAFRTLPKAELTLVHAVPRAGAGMADRLETQFAEFLAGLEDVPATVRKETPEGPPVPTLMKAIERLAPDLVVVGTHGRTGVGPLQIGTVAERLLSQSAIDVLAVRV